MRSRIRVLAVCGVIVAGSLASARAGSSGVVMGTPHYMRPFTGHTSPVPQAGPPLSYHGGVEGIGVQTNPAVYLVFYGWTQDPSNMSRYVTSFLAGIGGTSWNNSVTQYCQNVPTGTTNCVLYPGAVYGGNPSNMLKGVWYDARPAPKTPSDHQLAVEAIDAALHFGNRTPESNLNTQYVIATAKDKNTPGFGSSFCAWHDWAFDATVGKVAFTNLPYIPQAGSSCGANFVNPGADGLLDGVSIVEGHELAETETDPYPSGGWWEPSGGENADKCAWISSGQGAMKNLFLSTGRFAVQSLWSNAFAGGVGGCVQSYP